MMKKLLCSLLFTVIAVGFMNAQSIDVTGLGVVIAGDGSNTPSILDDTQFGSVDATSGSVSHTFTINNLTTDILIVGLENLTNSIDFSQSTSPTPNTILSGGTSTYSVTFDPASVGLKSSVVQVNVFNLTTAANESYFFNVEGTGTTPAAEPIINVLGGGTFITNGDTTPSTLDDTDFGDVDITSGSVTNTYTILNTGTADLTFSAPVLFIGSSDFTVISQPTSPITPGNSSTFQITFDPSGTGPISGTVLIQSNDLDENPFAFTIQGNGTEVILEPEIDVTGNGISIATGDTTPSVSDDTDFGDVDIAAGAVTNTFTINNTGTADLILTSNVLVVGSSDFSVSVQPSSPVSAAGSTTFVISYDPVTAVPASATVIVQSNDADENPYTFAIQGNGISVPVEPEMDVLDNIGAALAVGGTVDFGSVNVTSGSTAFTFTIENNGVSTLNLTDASPFVVIGGTNDADFTLTAVPSSSIAPAGSTTFTITFDPTVIESKIATVSIANDDADENPYTFNLIGEGVDVGTDSQLMITQYYEGTGGGNDNWIEVKNISTTNYVSGGPGQFFLALYPGINGTIIGGIATLPPTQSIVIPSIPAGGVHLFSGTGASLPSAGNRGSAPVTSTAVCNFDGNDIILISSSNDEFCYDGRVDIIGTVGDTSAVNWGPDTALIKGCGTTELPTTTYTGDYLTLTLDEVNNAVSNTNIALGTQTVGSTVWTSSWSNGIPDKTKETIVNGTYTNSGGSFESCNLTVNPGAVINFNSGGAGSNYILVDNNLAINGTFTLGDTESLITTNEFANITGSINKIESTTTLNNFRDFTYWSSPVSTTIESTFAGVERIFRWDTPSSSWFPKTGTMVAGEGYIAEATPSTPDGGTYSTVFSGSPNNGGIGIAVQFNNDGIAGTDYNLIGNPYPSAIDIREFINYDIIDGQGVIQNNGFINGTVFLWTHNTQISGGTQGDFVRDDYAAVNLTGGIQAASGGTIPTFFIGSGQGFLVRTNGLNTSGGVVFFQNTMRVNDENDTPFFKSKDKSAAADEETDRIWLDMTTEDGGFSQILIGFFDGATDAEDRGYDGERLSTSRVKLYSTIDENKFGIQGLGTFNQSKEIALGMDTDVAKTFKISIAKIEGILKDEDVYLADNTLGVVHDLKQGDYEFEVPEAGNFADRFTLKFNSGVLNTDDFELNNSFIVFSENNTLKLKSSDEISNLKIYDITGRLLVESEPKSLAFDLPVQNIKEGTVLILNATMKNGATVSKKAIKY